MINNLYQTGLELSKNYTTRTKEQDTALYSIIQFASNTVRLNVDTPLVDKSLQFLTFTFEPLIKKIAFYYYEKVSSFEEYDDVLQECYTLFLMLTYKYDPDKSSFSYYINDMLPRYVYSWVQKIILRQAINNECEEIEGFCDPYLYDRNSVYNQFDVSILEKEYENFILARATRNVRSNTVPEVCYNYFLDKKTCSEIARDLNISYQAVREVINKIKEELKVFFSESIFTDYMLTDIKKFLEP